MIIYIKGIKSSFCIFILLRFFHIALTYETRLHIVGLHFFLTLKSWCWIVLTIFIFYGINCRVIQSFRLLNSIYTIIKLEFLLKLMISWLELLNLYLRGLILNCNVIKTLVFILRYLGTGVHIIKCLSGITFLRWYITFLEWLSIIFWIIWGSIDLQYI